MASKRTGLTAQIPAGRSRKWVVEGIRKIQNNKSIRTIDNNILRAPEINKNKIQILIFDFFDRNFFVIIFTRSRSLWKAFDFIKNTGCVMNYCTKKNLINS